MNDTLDRIFQLHYADRDGSALGHASSSIRFETGALLYEFVRRERPLRTLETGMAYGMSTLFICQALRDNGAGRHTAIDPSQTERFGGGGLHNVEHAGLADLLRFYEERSDQVLPRLCAEGERFDFAFVDGNHRFDFTLVDFFYVDRLLPVGGHVAFDDLWLPAVRKVISYALRNRPYRRVSALAARPPAWNRLLATGRRILQNPLERDWRLKLAPGNVAFLRKTGDEIRDWRSHRPF
ncbi:MAG TPA: class I SAM-dependent methyltransferase [Gemmatimonadota bacterium]